MMNQDPRTDDLLCRAYGVEFRVVCGADQRDEVLEHLPHDTELAGAISPGATSFAVTPETLEDFGQRLMIHVANHAPDRVFVHAGVVSVNGRGLMLPGTSFAGKSTLVAALARAGATYYSDEYAVIDAQGLVFPYARDLQMRQPGRREQAALRVSSLGAAAGAEPVRITHILFARYVADAIWRPEPVSSGVAVLEMLQHAIPIQRTPARVLSTLTALMGSARAWRSERGECADVVPRILHVLEHGDDLG